MKTENDYNQWLIDPKTRIRQSPICPKFETAKHYTFSSVPQFQTYSMEKNKKMNMTSKDNSKISYTFVIVFCKTL